MTTERFSRRWWIIGDIQSSLGFSIYLLGREGVNVDTPNEKVRDEPALDATRVSTTGERFRRPWWPLSEVRSSEGFAVASAGPHLLRYTETREMVVDSEMGGVDRVMFVYPDSITRWDPPHHALELSPRERERVYGNVKRALEWDGFKVVN